MYDDVGFVPRKVVTTPWHLWFAWRPVKLNNRWVWLTRVYRKCINTYVDHDDWKRYEYGTILDVIKGSD